MLNEDKGLLGKARAASELSLAESKLKVGPSCISLSNYSTGKSGLLPVQVNGYNSSSFDMCRQKFVKWHYIIG